MAISGLHAIAPTNYFCLDGFEEVITALDQGELGDVACVLPNIEFRIDQSNKDGSHIHVHVLFSDRFTRDTAPIQTFLNNLDLLMTTGDNKVERCTEETVTRLGADRLLVMLRELDDKLNDSFNRLDDYILIAGSRGLGNFRPGENDSRGNTLAIEIDKLCDAIYGSSQADRDFFLQPNRYDGAIEKPVLLASDAHCSSDVGRRRTWIRSNPTFEGLKQAVFEPQLRVSISDPITQKSLYSRIDSIRLMSQNEDTNFFQKEPIPFNSDLTVIIGGKSTGKSLLLHYLARTIDEPQVLEREAVVFGDRFQHYDFDLQTGFDVEVRWSDGHNETFVGRHSGQGIRKIVYIPQRFLNSICELNIPAGSRSLDYFTKAALRQKPALAIEFDNLNSAKTQYQRDSRDALDRLFDQHVKYLEVQKRLYETGDEEGIKIEIARLDKEISRMRDASSMTDVQKSEYDTLSSELLEVSTTEEQLRADARIIASTKDSAFRAITRFDTAVAELLDSLEHPLLKVTATDAFTHLNDLSIRIDTAFTQITDRSRSLHSDLDKRRKTAEGALKPLASSVQSQKQLEELAKKRSEETQRLSMVQTLTKQSSAHTMALVSEIEKLTSLFAELLETYANVCTALATESDALGDISFEARTVFDKRSFTEHFVEKAVKVRTLNVCLNKSGPFEFEFNAATHISFLKTVGNALLQRKVELMKGVALRVALEALFENRLMIDYQIEYKSDKIESMSPGKRALVVLKILLELSSDECPILLDQPDDDLDSRSVYRELVMYFKSKKRFRQIILVTHNPNLVIGSDADEVIVANQSGQEPDRENVASRFEYLSGALECTFENAQVDGILHQQGIREHVCEILEGGSDAFLERERKYRLRKSCRQR